MDPRTSCVLPSEVNVESFVIARNACEAHIGVTASHRPARCARTRLTRGVGRSLERHTLRLTQHSFTRNGPREGG